MSLHPNCPQCGYPPAFVFPNQSWCSNTTSCRVITWNPNVPYDPSTAETIDLSFLVDAERPKPPEPPSFTCPQCSATSYSRRDIEEGYCGRCHAWTGR